MQMPNNKKIWRTFFTAIGGLTVALQGTVGSAQTFYSGGGWPTLHQDAGNRRNANVEVLHNSYRTWSALAGASVLTSPVTSPDGKRLYVATGLSRGQSNLYAFSIDGELLWQAEPWEDANTGIDPCAILSSPIVDTEGDVYISDCNQLFAFNADGQQKWIADLPAPRPGDWVPAGDHPVNAFTTAAFTADGHVVGITNFGDVLIVERQTGKQLNTPYRLATELSPYSEKHALPKSLLAKGLMDPDFREWTWQVIFAGNMRSANTPAVAKSGRVFLVGSSDKPGIGALFGLDIDISQTPYRVNTAFMTRIGIGSGSSPVLSPTEDRVYVSDEDGWLYAIDSQSGAIQWKVETAAAAGAAAVGHDGVIYALQEYPAPAVVAISHDGEKLWESATNHLVADLPSSFVLGEPVTVANGNPVVTRDAVLVPVTYSYRLPFSDTGIPTRSVVVALDRANGKALKEVVDLVDDSSGITAVLPDGTLINSIGSVHSSAILPLKPITDLLLPDSLSQLEAVGGIQVSIPASQHSP